MVFVRFDWFQGWEEFVRSGSFDFGVEVARTIEEVEFLMLVFRTGEFANSVADTTPQIVLWRGCVKRPVTIEVN